VFPCLLMTRSTVGRVRRARNSTRILHTDLHCYCTEYAFGVSELLLHRLKDWPLKGPLTPMAKHFFWQSNLPLHYKFSS
jgi:hypothetical protein